MRCVRIFVEGRVQGVGFRAFVADEARRRDLTGFVRNVRDGRVEVFAQGVSDNVAGLCEACRHGPRGAEVERTEISSAAERPEVMDFSIMSTV